MSVKVKVRLGGLMRCCLATLDEAMLATDTVPKEGDRLACKYHDKGDGDTMVFHDNAWEWVGPKRGD